MQITQESSKPKWTININDLVFEHKKKPLDFLMKECTEFRSAPQQANVDFFECNTARDYIAALIVLSLHHNPRNMLQIEPFLEKAARAAYYNNYEGKWIVVKDLLDTKHFCLHSMFSKLPRYFSPEEFFGNILPDCKRMLKSVRFRMWHHRSTAPVKRKQRPRGYTDKGTRTPLHKETLGVNDTPELKSLELRRLSRLGTMPERFTPREDRLIETRIHRNPGIQKLSSLYDELFKIQEELNHVKETEQIIRTRIRSLNRQLKRTIRRREKEEEKLRVSRGELRAQN